MAEEEAKKKEEAEARAMAKAAADAKVGIRILVKFVCVFSKSTLCFLCLREMETIEYESILNFFARVPVNRANSLAWFFQPRKALGSLHPVRDRNTLQETRLSN
jgi:hypothetical protein